LPELRKLLVTLNIRSTTIRAALAVAVLSLGTLSVAADEAVVATVNGKKITEADMRFAEAEIGADLGNLPEATKRRVLAEFLIENQLFADAADAEKLGSGPAFEERMQYWRRRALRDSYFEKAVKSTVSEAAAKTFYDDQVKLLKPEEEVQARHILVDSEAKAKEIAEKIKGGGDFAALAKEHSRDPGSKDDGGMLGYFSRGQMVPQFEEAAFGLQKGELSNPVQSQFGWHLIKLEDRRAKAPPSFDQVKDRILASLVHRKAQDATTALREKAKVEFVDPEIKKQAEDDARKQAEQKKAFEDQLKAQIEKMEAEQKAKDAK
jgi:peptidyl-prolyl cis-trans isomerase C